jgi:uncharacterized protein DUF6049
VSRLAALAGVAALTALPLLPATSAAAPAADALSVSITSLGPLVPTLHHRVRVAGTVTNTGEVTVSAPQVVLRFSQIPLYSRDDLDQVAVATPGLRDGFPIESTRTDLGPAGSGADLAPGEHLSFSLRASPGDLGLDHLPFGVYVVGVEAYGTPPAGFPVRLGGTKTFLPWAPPDAKLRPTRLVWLWPLVDRPHEQLSGQFTDDGLAASLRPGGRLRSLLDVGSGHDVTWVLDPDLLATAADMARGYQVHTSDAAAAPGRGGGAAASWLTDARRELGGRARADVVTLPYADPDAAALEHAGLGERLPSALVAGRVSAAGSLRRRTLTGDVAWPAGGAADEATLSRLRAAGARSVILDEAALPLAVDLRYTPTGRTSLPTASGSLDALLSDDVLSGLTTPAPGAAALVSARQRFLAETAMITGELPTSPRTVLVAPPRHWLPRADYLGPLLDTLQRAPWVRMESLDGMRNRQPPVATPRRPLSYPDSARRSELSASILAATQRLQRSARRLAAILPAGQAPGDVQRAVERGASSAWRTRPRAGARFVSASQSQVSGQLDKVHIISRDLVTLSSKRGTIPVTVANDLDQPVSIRLTVTPQNGARLSVDQPAPRRIEAGRKVTIEVRASARSNGVALANARLRTPDGRALGPALALRVRATNYGTISVVVTLLALALLFVTAAVRIVRRARAARRSAQAPEQPRESERVPS